MEVLYCLDSVPNFLGVFDTTIAPPLLYYAYFPIVILSLALGIVVFVSRDKAGFSLHNKLFLIITILFSLHLFNEILQWIAAPAAFVYFGWQIISLFFTSLVLLLVYFAHVFVYREDLPVAKKYLLALLALPVILLVPTSLNMNGFDLYWCEAYTGVLYLYIYPLAILSALYILYTGFSHYQKQNARKSLLISIGAAAFITILILSDLFGEITGVFEINLTGPIGMLIFLTIISYTIVKFNAFNIRLIATELFVAALVAVVGSILFLRSIEYVQYVAGGSLILILILGWLLTRSVRREVQQRKRIEELAENLKKANTRLKVLDRMKSEFVSIASHQLRSPLTSIRGYASMLLEGSFGKLSKKAQEAVQRIVDSSRYMALSVEDYLNVSRIEAGNMKYEKSDFNLKSEAEKIVDEMRPAALKKGLLLLFKSDCDGSCSVHADIGKTRQVIMNLVDNSMKYTPKGSITVIAHDDVKKKKMYVTVQDTGVGMDTDTLEDVFDKFIRAKNANEVNVTGTGLGLFVAKKIVGEMGGRIWAESPGEGKGSSFHIELPLLPGKYR